jgi:predicted MFS family arabinose efflux permease
MHQKIWNKDFILLTLSNFLMCITYYAILSTLPLYLTNPLHASKSQVGIVLAAYTVASVIIRPFSGFALDKYGRRIIFLSALLLYTSLFLGYLVALTITTLLILRLAHGFSWGIVSISGSTSAVDLIPANKRGEGIGYFSLSTTLGMSVGPILGLFVCLHWGYDAMFLAAFATSAISLVCAYSIRHYKKGIKIAPQLSVGTLFDKSVILPSLNLLIIMSTYGGLLSFIAIYGREIGVQNTSLFFLLLSIGIAISRFTSGKTFDRKGPKSILTLCLCLLAAGFPLLALVQNATGYYSAALLIGFGLGVVFPIFQSMVNNMAKPEKRGAANSTLYTGLDLGMGAGMVVMGYVSEHFSITTSFWLSTAICLLGLAFFLHSVARNYENVISLNKLKS